MEDITVCSFGEDYNDADMVINMFSSANISNRIAGRVKGERNMCDIPLSVSEGRGLGDNTDGHGSGSVGACVLHSADFHGSGSRSNGLSVGGNIVRLVLGRWG